MSDGNGQTKRRERGDEAAGTDPKSDRNGWPGRVEGSSGRVEGRPDRRTDGSMTATSRLIDATIRRLLQYRPWVPWRPPVALAGIGVGLAVLSLSQAFVDPEPPGVALVECLLPLVGAALVLAAARWTTRVDRSVEKHASAVIVSLVFMAIALATVGVVLFTQLPRDVAGFDYPFAVVTALTAGAVVGTPNGFVFDEVIARQEALEAEFREVSRLNRRLQLVNRVVRHNVRNELTVALGGLEQHRARVDALATAGAERDGGTDGPAGSDADEWLDRSVSALERLLDHTEKLVQIESLERSADERITIDIASYVEGYLRTTDFDGVPVETDLPERARVRAHPLVGTAVAEVVENAVVHNDHEGLALHVRVEADGDEVEVVVADTGTGIPAVELEALDREGESRLVHSRGVGLWLVSWVVDVSGGRVAFDGNAPTGTVVRFRLPGA